MRQIISALTTPAFSINNLLLGEDRHIKNINDQIENNLGIETQDPSEHVGVLHGLDWHRGSANPQCQHLVALILLSSSPVRLADLIQTLLRINT